jgi:hypothetical protein
MMRSARSQKIESYQSVSQCHLASAAEIHRVFARFKAAASHFGICDMSDAVCGH